LLVIILLLAGCCPIRKSTIAQQRPAVKAATESSRDASNNWDAYDADQKKAWLKANAGSWEALNRVYNPKPKKEGE
jgi:uncharacterized protein YceK